MVQEHTSCYMLDCENKDGNVSYEHILCSMDGVCIIFCTDFYIMGYIYVQMYILRFALLRISTYYTIRQCYVPYLYISKIVPIYKVPLAVLYIYIYICVCVCVLHMNIALKRKHINVIHIDHKGA